MTGEYNKIDGPFTRDPANLKDVVVGAWRNPTVAMLADCPIWEATEKVDGTNLRIRWDGYGFSYAGRTDRAELHKDIFAKLDTLFKAPGVEEWFEEHFPLNLNDGGLVAVPDVVLYGEGYGAGIQKNGGRYSATKEFIGFDIAVNGKYLARDDSREIFKALSIPVLEPEFLGNTLTEIINYVAAGAASGFSTAENVFLVEGYVATTLEPLYDQRGNRLIVKVKTEDLRR